MQVSQAEAHLWGYIVSAFWFLNSCSIVVDMQSYVSFGVQHNDSTFIYLELITTVSL